MDRSRNLAKNIKQLRAARGVSQQQVAAMSGVPRATLAHLESGSANPTLSVMAKVAAAFKITLEELTAPPREEVAFYRREQLPSRNTGKVQIRKLLPDPLPGLDVERLELPPGAGMAGVPHTRGTREYLTCERGQLQLSVAGQTWTLNPGDVVVFRGDQKHGYKNPGSDPSVGYTVVCVG